MMKRKIHLNSSGIIFGIVLIAAALFMPFVYYAGRPALYAFGAAKSTNASDDTYSNAQWYITNPGYFIDYALGDGQKLDSTAGVDMNVAKAWENLKETKAADREVVVAIIDTGVDYTHKDLSGHIWVNKDEIKDDQIDNDNNGYVDDYYGWDFYNDDSSVCHYAKGKKAASAKDNDNHGTHIAGIIAAVADNDIGIAGIAANIDVKLMILKINGGKNEEGKMSDAIEAIKYATMMGADICNISWGTTEYSKELYEIMKESDMLFVAAAGNDGHNNDKKPLYPASFKLDNLISVTAINADGELPAFSNYGVNSVDIAAPGNDIFSTIVGSYGTMSGSSAAAPQVTAVAALMYACNDHIYASNVKDIILHNLKLLPDLENKIKYAGIPDAYNCIAAAGELLQDTEVPELSFQTVYNKKDMMIPIDIEDLGGSKIRVVKWIYGKKKAGDFKHGMNGTLVTDQKVNLSVAGTYTFYASDYAGNETAVTYEVVADEKAPALKVSYTVADDYKSRTVTIKASDEQSGIKRVKYMAGVKETKDFLPADSGKEITLKNGMASFTVKKDDTFTVFVSDFRGNMTVKTITVKTVKATNLQIRQIEVSISVGEDYYIKPVLKPVNSTDGLNFVSVNEQVAVVTGTGKVTALARGTSLITIKTSSGITAYCIITVNSDA